MFSLCSSPSLLTLQEVIRTNTQLQSAARALADQLDMRMKDLEAQSQRRVAAEQASLQAETERLKQVSGRIRDVTGAPPACLGQKHDTKHLPASKHGCPFLSGKCSWSFCTQSMQERVCALAWLLTSIAMSCCAYAKTQWFERSIHLGVQD